MGVTEEGKASGAGGEEREVGGGEEATLELWELEDAGESVAVESVAEPGPEPAWRRKAWRVVREVATTEASYVGKLALLHVDLRAGVAELPDVGEAERRALFANLASIYLFHQAHLLPGLKAALAGWEAREGGLAETLSSLAPYLRMYADYTAAFPSVQATFERLLKAQAAFRALVAELEALPECAKLPLSSHLICPVQRLTRYSLLLGEYKKQLPAGHAEVGRTEAAMAAVEAAAAHANAALRTVAEYGAVAGVEAEFGGRLRGLVTPSRRLVRRGDVSMAWGRLWLRRHLILFSDILLLASKPWLRSGLKLHAWMEVYEVLVSQPQPQDPAVFKLRAAGGKTATLRARDAKDGQAWQLEVTAAAARLYARMQTFVRN